MPELKAEERVEIARKAVAPLASQLGAHGLDVNSFVSQFADAKYQNLGQSQIAAQASFQFVKTVLTTHPELADPIIKAKLRGFSPEDQSLVNTVLSQSGKTGFEKYNYCEQVLKDIKGLDQEERGDVKTQLNLGTSYPNAMKYVSDDRKEIQAAKEREAKEAAQPEQSWQSLERQALAKRGVERENVLNLGRRVSEEWRGYSKIDRLDEVAFGGLVATGAAIGVVTGTARDLIEGGKKHLTQAADSAELSGEAMAGGLSDKVNAANEAYKKFGMLADSYEKAYQAYRIAVGNSNSIEVGVQAGIMNELIPQLESAAQVHHSKAVDAAKASGNMDKLLVTGTVNAATFTVGVVRGAGEAVNVLPTLGDKVADQTSRDLGMEMVTGKTAKEWTIAAGKAVVGCNVDAASMK